MADADIKELLQSLLASNQEIKEEIKQNRATISTEIKKLKEDLHGEIQELRGENQLLKEEVNRLKDQLKKVDEETKKYKVMIYGLEETETADDLQTDITSCLKLFNNKLGLSCVFGDLRNVYRVGKFISGKRRPISIETNSFFLRKDILKNAKKLKGTKIFISAEYTKSEYEERKILHNHLKEARQNNQVAQIKNKKLIVDGREYCLEELKHISGCKLPKISRETDHQGTTSKRKQSQTEAQDEENPNKRVTRNQANREHKI